jgi:hypothetical protein
MNGVEGARLLADLPVPGGVAPKGAVLLDVFAALKGT